MKFAQFYNASWLRKSKAFEESNQCYNKITLLTFKEDFIIQFDSARQIKLLIPHKFVIPQLNAPHLTVAYLPYGKYKDVFIIQ